MVTSNLPIAHVSLPKKTSFQYLTKEENVKDQPSFDLIFFFFPCRYSHRNQEIYQGTARDWLVDGEDGEDSLLECLDSLVTT